MYTYLELKLACIIMTYQQIICTPFTYMILLNKSIISNCYRNCYNLLK